MVVQFKPFMEERMPFISGTVELSNKNPALSIKQITQGKTIVIKTEKYCLHFVQKTTFAFHFLYSESFPRREKV